TEGGGIMDELIECMENIVDDIENGSSSNVILEKRIKSATEKFNELIDDLRNYKREVVECGRIS
ncbi:MAG: hypothetical protein WCT23_10375, partial [Candidatus Neomarinimicrobiota bacterium]